MVGVEVKDLVGGPGTHHLQLPTKIKFLNSRNKKEVVLAGDSIESTKISKMLEFFIKIY